MVNGIFHYGLYGVFRYDDLIILRGDFDIIMDLSPKTRALDSKVILGYFDCIPQRDFVPAFAQANPVEIRHGPCNSGNIFYPPKFR